MAQTYHNCKPGNWYGFGNTSDFNVGQTVQVQFGAWDDGSSKLNIYLARPGGSLVDPLVLNAGFDRSSSVYHVYNSSSTCLLDQLNLTLPSTAGVAANAVETFQFGIFNSSVSLGVNGNPLSGFLAWSPDFQVWNNATTTTTTTSSAAPSTTSTSHASATSAPNQNPAATTAPAQTDNGSSGLSPGAKAGIGVGVALGCVLIAALLIGLFLRNRTRKTVSSGGSMEEYSKFQGHTMNVPGSTNDSALQPSKLHELPPGSNQQTDVKWHYQPVSQQTGLHELPPTSQAYEMP